jgi:hypothetical protein
MTLPSNHKLKFIGHFTDNRQLTTWHHRREQSSPSNTDADTLATRVALGHFGEVHLILIEVHEVLTVVEGRTA